MGRALKVVLGIVAVLVVLIAGAAAILPSFLNADSFRARIQTEATKSLGRQVTIGKLALSIFSGGLVANQVAIADDPRFSNQPFLQADSVKIRVELIPLILHREVHIQGFTLQDPKVNLFQSYPAAAGGPTVWNYSTLGASSSAPQAKATSNNGSLSSLTAGSIEIANGSITVGKRPQSAAAPDHTYQNVDLTIKNFSSEKSFPYELSASLPGQGTVSAKGNAGPIDQRDAANTPFTLDLQTKHIDPLAAGFVDQSAGISGLIETFNLQAAWNGQQMHISQLTLEKPAVTIVQTNQPKPKKAPEKPDQTSLLQQLSVDTASISNGSVTLTTPGKSGAPVVYQNINAKLTNLTPKSQSPFQLTADLPGSGSVAANGRLGPYNQVDASQTPVSANVNLKGIQLGQAGILPPDAGIGGTLGMQAQVQSNGQVLQAAGKGQVQGLRLARGATPSPKPLDVDFAVNKDLNANTGQIQHATLSVGGAVLTLGGTFQSAGPSTALNIKVNGNQVPIDAIEAFLPALGINLPQGSQLKGGSVTTALTVSGSSASPAISGPVKLAGTQLAGFDLGSKLGQLSQLTGGRLGGATGSGTNIRSLSMNVREQGNNIATNDIALDVTGVGTATGNGTVSAAGALDYTMLLKLTGLTGGGGTAAQPAQAPAQQQSKGGLGGLLGGVTGGGGGGAAGIGGLIPGGKGLGAAGGISSSLLAKGIPVEITGTTAQPRFAPNLKGLTAGVGAAAAQQFLNGKTGGAAGAAQGNGAQQQQPQKPADQIKKGLGGLLGH